MMKPRQPQRRDRRAVAAHADAARLAIPLPNYTLSSTCPACQAVMKRRACKVLCPRCGFMWDCSEL